MQHHIEHRPSYALAVVDLEQGERIVAEAGAMAWKSANVRTETKMRGGLMGSLKRKLLSGETLFQNTFEAEGGPGRVALAPGPAGDVQTLSMDRGELLLEKGAYLASTEGVECDAKWSGLSGFFNEGLFVLRVTGSGVLFMTAYGQLQEIEVNGSYTVDNGFAVAWEPQLSYRLTKARRIRSFLFSDQLLLRFEGRGKVWVQSRSPQALASWIHPFRRVERRNQE